MRKIFHGSYSPRSAMLIAFATVMAGTAAAPNQLEIKSTKQTSDPLCETKVCVKAASTILKRMNQNANPCSNFYQFVCGKFTEVTPFYDSKEMADKISQDLPGHPFNDIKEIADATKEESEVEDRPYFEHLADSFYQSCRNPETTSNEENELKEIFEKLGGWPMLKGSNWNEDNFDWKKLMIESGKLGYEDIFFRFFVDVNQLDLSDQFFFQIDPFVRFSITKRWYNRDQLLKGPLKNRYFNYMTNVIEILGADVEKAKDEISNLFDFELKLARLDIGHGRLERIAVKEMDTRYPNVTWNKFINDILAPYAHVHENDTILVHNTHFLKDVLSVIQNTPKRVLANYAMWRITHLTISAAKGHLADAVNKFISLEDRRDCTKLTRESLPEAMEALYIRWSKFDKNSQHRVEHFVKKVNASFHDMIAQADWIDDATKSQTFDTLNSIIENADIGYPDLYLDNNKMNEFYKNVTVYPDNFFKFTISMKRFNMVKRFSNLGKIVKLVGRKSYNGLDRFRNVRYNEKIHKLVVPGESFDQYYSEYKPNYLNYGALGWPVGQAISQAIRHLDGTKKIYHAEVEKCLAKQYEDYPDKEPNFLGDESEIPNENLYDNAGLRAAYIAYDKSLIELGSEEQLPGLNYTSRQMFWISGAGNMCGRPQFWDEAPAEYRVTRSMSNIPEFSRDFNCPLESPMNPSKKCAVW